MSVERFWQLTPAEILIEIEAWNKREEMTDYRFGLLCSVIIEPHRDQDKKPEPYTPADFMPKYQEPKKEQTVEEQLEILKILTAAYGGEVVITDG